MAWIGGAIAGGAGLLGSILGSDAATSAANTQANSANQASQLQYQLGMNSLGLNQQIFNQTSQNFAPYLNAGNSALNTYLQALGLGPINTTANAPISIPGVPGSAPATQPQAGSTSPVPAGPPNGAQPGTPQYAAWVLANQGKYPGVNLFNGIPATATAAPATHMQPQAAAASRVSTQAGAPIPELQNMDFTKYLSSLPGYQFQLSQGEDALKNLVSSGAVAPGGNTERAALQLGQGLGSSYWDKWMGQLAGLTSAGQSAAGNQGSLGATLGSQAGSTLGNLGASIGSNTIGAGNALAAGQIASTNQITNALKQLTNLYGNNQNTSIDNSSMFNTPVIGNNSFAVPNTDITV
jgi:hypothetical protein